MRIANFYRIHGLYQHKNGDKHEKGQLFVAPLHNIPLKKGAVESHYEINAVN